jgi:Ca2+-transporting ATPase
VGETFGQVNDCRRDHHEMLALDAPPAPAHRLPVDEVERLLATDRSAGLAAAEAARRLAEYGPNRLDDVKPVPAWRRFVRQFADLLILILVGAAVVAFVVSGELKTPLVVLAVVILNAVIGFVQESKAERSLDALRQMLVSQARVRRAGQVQIVAAEDIVPGDVVLVEAGDRIPADGRLTVAVNVEAEEAALTGESQPVEKSIDAVDRDDAPLGERVGMVFANTTVTRGRGEMLITATGMRTEIGRIAGMLSAAQVDKSPLQRQLDRLAHGLVRLAAVIVGAVFVIGVARGEPLDDLLLTAVALAVASIPEGLPAVTAVTLALGVGRMARRHAIVKRLASVETLGCTTVICSDKTGTLTLNEMTARAVILGGRRHDVTGQGYEPVGAIVGADHDTRWALDHAIDAATLCSDAVVRTDDDGRAQLVGDPTEGALVVLAAKHGVDVLDVRRRHPRLVEIPFESANKYMATAHEMVTDAGERVVRLFVKGAPDVLRARSRRVIGAGGEALAGAAAAAAVDAHNLTLASHGMRVLALASRDIDLDAWNEFTASDGDPHDLVRDLTLLALVGIVDPARPEAAAAIADAHGAGIRVKMITGDHAVTARAIGRELGLRGRAVTGVELDSMTDEQLIAELDHIDVFARVAPEHKLRLVDVFQRAGHVVAMTGDGVNDAPALKKADIGVAMGITGTEVSKEAATMVLTDDNFATIVSAVGEGRTIYGNIVKFVRFQLSTTLGFAMLFLLAGALGVASGKPFTAIVVLWVNLIMDGPPAMALGLDRGDPGVMQRPPRPTEERILTKSRWTAVAFAAIVMAIGTLAVLEWAPGTAVAGEATVAGTMAFATFVFFQFFNILNARSDDGSVFRRHTLTNGWLWASLAAVIVLVTHVHVLQRLFDTTDLSIGQWMVAVAVASSVLWLEELRKLAARRRHSPSSRYSMSATMSSSVASNE